MASNYFIKSGYRIREVPVYWDDVATSRGDAPVWQPDVYPFAAYLARRFRCSYIIDIGCGSAQKLIKLHPEFQVIGIDFKDNIKYCRQEFPFGQWIEWNLDEPGVIPIQSNVLSNAVIISADVIEHLMHPESLLENLRVCLNYAPVALLSTPERERTRGRKDVGPPMNLSHVREWNQSELEGLLKSYDLHVEFMGLTRSDDKDCGRWTSLAVLGINQQPQICPAPVDFRVISIMTASNEESIILPSLNYLISNGIEVYVINNGSNDATGDLARSLLGKGVIGVEDFRSESSASSSQDECLLDRIAEISNMLKANWFMHQNANELRESPWSWATLKDAIYYVNQRGFNCIDHTILNFYPAGGGFRPSSDFSTYYKYYEWAPDSDQSRQVNVWKHLDQQVHFTPEGGSNIDFEGSYVFPYKFLMKRYISPSPKNSCKISRNPWQNLWKIFTEGRPDAHFSQEDQRIELSQFDPSSFYKSFLVERLSGLNSDLLHRDSHSRWIGSNSKDIKSLVKWIKATRIDPYLPLIRQENQN